MLKIGSFEVLIRAEMYIVKVFSGKVCLLIQNNCMITQKELIVCLLKRALIRMTNFCVYIFKSGQIQQFGVKPIILNNDNWHLL